jgi:hypothetical protein
LSSITETLPSSLKSLKTKPNTHEKRSIKMTKKVRIENADTNHSVELVVEVMDTSPSANAITVLDTIILSNCSDVTELYISKDTSIRITERFKNAS